MPYALSTTLTQPFDQALTAMRQALAEQGFGILTEIDLAATLKAKLDADIAPHVILGACRPPLALAALSVEPGIGLLLPCNVVVRAVDGGATVVEAVDPAIMVEVTANPALQPVAEEARQRLCDALARLVTRPAPLTDD